jgi:hypothetical protein
MQLINSKVPIIYNLDLCNSYHAVLYRLTYNIIVIRMNCVHLFVGGNFYVSFTYIVINREVLWVA